MSEYSGVRIPVPGPKPTPAPAPEPPVSHVSTSGQPQEPTPRDAGAPDPGAPDPAASDAGAPETGDLVIDAALRDLASAPADDLDTQIERGEQVQRTLQGRLGDLGG